MEWWVLIYFVFSFIYQFHCFIHLSRYMSLSPSNNIDALLYIFVYKLYQLPKTLCMTFTTDLKQLPRAFLENACYILFCARFCVLFDLNILEGWLIVVISVGGHCSPGQCSALSKFRQFGQYWGNTGHWWRARLLISKLSSSGPGPAGAAQSSETWTWAIFRWL